MDIKKFQKFILDWYAENRRDLPWRRTRDPYKILVSEVMLQQTQISRVLPKYKEFLHAFPTLEALAKAPDKKLLNVWAGLGYWRRAKFLKKTAKIILKQYKGKFPKIPKELEKLPGVGPYTARALACFAFGNTEAFLDTNIRRVYLNFFFPKSKKVPDKKILEIAQKTTTSLRIYENSKYRLVTPREWHYALFDYGALVLKDKTINKRSRHYHKQSKFEGSFRSFRTKAVRFLLKQPKNRATHRQLSSFLQKELVDLKGQQVYTPKQIIDALLKDNLIKKSATHYFL